MKNTLSTIYIFVDGEFLRKRFFTTKKIFYNTENIIQYLQNHIDINKGYYIYYYDAIPKHGIALHPLTQKNIHLWNNNIYEKKSIIINGMKQYKNIKTCLGYISWSNKWIVSHEGINKIIKNEPINDNEIIPDFKQKSVDVQLSIDMVEIAITQNNTEFVLIANDGDFEYALEKCKKYGVDVTLDSLGVKIPDSLKRNIKREKTYI